MNVYLCTDLEGVAGVVSFETQTEPGNPGFEAAQRLLTAEVNAAVEGLAEAGADEILVLDGHGPGGIAFEMLHPRASLLHGRPLAPRTVRDALVAEYDVCMMIGQHAMAGNTRGSLSHTQSSKTVESYTLNGEAIGEIAQFVFYCATLGLPCIFLSGDEEACAEARELIPEIVAVPVKRSLSRHSAVSLAPAAARERIRAGAREALRAFADDPREALCPSPPYVLDKRFFSMDVANREAAKPGAQRLDALTVRFCSDDLRELIYR